MLSTAELFGRVFLVSFFLNFILPIFPSYTNGMMYHVLLVSLFPVFFLVFCFKMKETDFILSIFFLLFFLIATVIPIFKSNGNLIDAFSGLKIIYFWLYFAMGYVYGYTINLSNRKIKKLYFTVLVISLLISVIELYIPQVSYFLYKRESFDLLSDKLTSLFNTTYHYGFFLFFGFCLYVSKLFSLLDCKFDTGFRDFTVNGFIVLVIFVLIFLTQSRIFILVALMLLFLKISFVLLQRFFDLRVVLSVTILVVLISSAFFNFFSEIEERFSYVVNGISYLFSGGVDFSGGGTGSFNTRVNQILFAWDAISSNIFFGAGVGKDLYLETVYAYLIYKYGLIGLFLFFIMTFIFISFSKLSELSTDEFDDKYFYNGLFWFFSLSPVYFLSGPLFEVPKLSMYFFCLAGVAIGSCRRYFFMGR